MAAAIQVVHELPKRVRWRAEWLKRREPEVLRAMLINLHGVSAASVNPRLGTVVVAYDGVNATRQSVHHLLHTFAKLPAGRGAHPVPRPVALPPLGGALFLLLIRLLPRPLRAPLTWLRLAPSLWQGANSLLQRGLTVEAMDAVAVALSAWRGDYAAAMATRFLVEVGETLQESVDRRADDTLHRLLPGLPDEAWVERDGQVVRVSSSAVALDDRVVVGVGEMIPVDGEVVGGVAQVNESSLTGEPLPVRKEAGDAAISGTVVEEGRLTIRAVRVGERTAIARIGRFIAHASLVPSCHQRLAETLAQKRVRLTFAMGGLVWLLTRDLRRAAASLLVDFSCGIKISTPVAFKAAMIHAGREGVLIKGGETLEHLALADTVIFDKTGTLTGGHLEIAQVVSFHPGCPEDRLLAVAASMEEHAPHPLAEAVVREGNRRALPHVPHGEVEFIVAHGLHARVDGVSIHLGSRHYLEEDEGISFAAHQEVLEALQAQGLILLLAARDKEAAGVIALRDYPRPEAPEVIAALRGLGIRHLVMLTGDGQAKAEATAAELGLDQVFWDMVPEQKAHVVTELKQQGRRVIFVGDGINDSPSLAVADAGIAMPRGAELARDTADVVLLHDRLEGVVLARSLAMRTLAVIGGNFSTAVSVNSAILTGASMGWLSPVVTSLLHNGTTLAILARSWSLSNDSLVPKIEWKD
ncbi:MAG: heavy metal translocating P-type ATPase [Magnetococcales bacterium]|nr:heavy metal translocating P-type ATPase [Magnetococcales bacterium]MBF0114513.1 heavy metal translocating P-type ATPase [Magnetococcales bacterium]